MTYTPTVGQIWPQGQPKQKRKNSLFGFFDAGQYLIEGYNQPFSTDAIIADPEFDKVTLLLDMEGVAGSSTFVDRSNAENIITPFNGAAISNIRAKFGSGSYSNSNQNRYLEINGTAGLSFPGDFTIEVWFWAETSQPAYPAVFEIGSYTNGILFRPYHSGGGLWINGNNYGDFLNETLIPKQQWNHAAFVRSGSSFVCYLNGQIDKTATISTTVNSTLAPSRFGGATHTSGQHLNGYIDEVRVTKGFARYLAPFTPPTEPFPIAPDPEPEPEPPSGSDPDFSSVSLLLHMDGTNGSTTFTDSSSNAVSVTAGGNAQVSTTDPKYGTGCLTLDGSGGYLAVAADADFQFGTGDFTVECWVNPNSGNSNNGLFTFGGTNSGLAVAVYVGQWVLTTTGAGGFSMGAVTTGTWQHLAVARRGSSLRMFIDGTQIGSTLSNSTDLSDNALKVGYYYSSSFSINARIDEFRVTKGVARYTANFTPPTAPFPNS
jgi:hypothetical protein